MVRQLLAARVSVRSAKGNWLSPVYQEASRYNNLGSLSGALHAKSVIIGEHVFVGSANWPVASRANQECSVHLTLDESTADKVNDFFDAVWNNAQVVKTAFLMDQMNERLRVQAAKKLNNG